ncbi:Zinc finger, BED-type [Sesbania bispinosa]|nr:Zinc finger, BED-type [Sesbania bispinosa]
MLSPLSLRFSPLDSVRLLSMSHAFFLCFLHLPGWFCICYSSGVFSLFDSSHGHGARFTGSVLWLCCAFCGDNTQDNEVNEDGPKDPKVRSKRARNTSSSVWNYFDKVAVGSDGKERAQCKSCGKEYVSGGNKYETSTLLRHISKCEKVPKGFADTEVGKLMLDQSRNNTIQLTC